MIAFAGPRPGDYWTTIWLTAIGGGEVRDLVGDRFPDPGVRSLSIPGWLSTHEPIVAFPESGSVSYSILDIGTGQYTPACGFTVDGRTRWVDGHRRAFLGGHLGALPAIEIESSSTGLEIRCVQVFPGCKGNAHWYSYEDGPTEEAPVLVARHPCIGMTPDALLGDPLFVMRGLDEAPERLPFGSAPASWSPDGRYLVVRTPADELVQVTVDGLESRRLGKRPTRGGAYYVGWSPDSRWLTIHDFRTLYVIDTGGEFQADP